MHQAGCTPPLRLPSPPLAMWCSMMQPRLQCHEDIFRPGQCHMGWHILSIAQSCANVYAWHPPWLPLDSTRFTKAKHHCNQIALLNPNVLHKSHSALDIICLWLFIHLSISLHFVAFWGRDHDMMTFATVMTKRDLPMGPSATSTIIELDSTPW